MTCPRKILRALSYIYTRLEQMELEDHRLMNAIQAINKQGFESIGNFLTTFLSSGDTRVNKIADNFTREWSIMIIPTYYEGRDGDQGNDEQQKVQTCFRQN